jgi:hypothetical protein
MDLPSLRHFRNEGIYFIFSDPVEALIGEAWVPARYTDKGWATADGSSLLSGIEDWRHAVEEREVTGCDLGEHQTRDQGRQKPSASSSNRVRKSRKVTQEEES